MPVTIDLKQHLHLDFHLSSLVEMTLSANLRKAAADEARLRWRVANETDATMDATSEKAVASPTSNGEPLIVTLKPREIKTFLLNIQPEDVK